MQVFVDDAKHMEKMKGVRHKSLRKGLDELHS